MFRSLLLLAAGLTLWPQAGLPQQPQPGAISGVVADAITGQPLAGATVTLARIGNPAAGVASPPATRVLTDAKGRFIFAGIAPAEDYYLGARNPGYEYTRYGWTAPGQTLAINDILRIAVTPGGWVPDIKIPLWRLPMIGGRVVDERGEPVVGVAVRAFTKATIAGNAQTVGTSITSTDDRGVYRITGLPPGRYIVSVLSVQSTVLASTPEGAAVRAVGELQTGGVTAGGPAAIVGPGIDLDGRHRLALTNFMTPPPPASSQARAYASQFYPGVSSADEASVIELGYQQAQLAIDFQLRPVPAVRVSGTVTGLPSPGLLLRLMPEGSEGLGFGSEAATTVIESDGTFTFFNVPAGRYTLVARPSVIDFSVGDVMTRLPDAPGFRGGGAGVGSRNGMPGISYLARYGARAPSWGRMSVSVGSANIDDLTLLMHPMGKVSGRFAFVDGMTVPANARPTVNAEPANGDPSLGLASAVATLTNGEYTFNLEGLLGGTYLLEAGPYAVVSVTARGRDITTTGVDAASSPDTADVVITVTDKTQVISGTVTVPAGKSAGVIVFPADRAQWTNYGWNGRGFRTTRAGSTGAYTLRPSMAGEYYVIAVDTTKLDAWTDPKFLAAASALATRVTLGWGETRTVDLAWRDVK